MNIKLDKEDIKFIQRMIRKEILHWKRLGEKELIEELNTDELEELKNE